MRLIAITLGGIVASYLAWAYGTAEGRTCGRLVKSELAHYRVEKARHA